MNPPKPGQQVVLRALTPPFKGACPCRCTAPNLRRALAEMVMEVIEHDPNSFCGVCRHWHQDGPGDPMVSVRLPAPIEIAGERVLLLVVPIRLLEVIPQSRDSDAPKPHEEIRPEWVQ